MGTKLTGRPSGRPCVVCSSANRSGVEAAVKRGAAVSLIGRHYAISPSSIRRHIANHPQLPPPQPVRTASKSNGRGGATSLPPPPPPRTFRHPQRWWTPTDPGPRRGDRCTACGRKDDNWWYIPGSHGGCVCWSPVFYGLRKLQFFPRVVTQGVSGGGGDRLGRSGATGDSSVRGRQPSVEDASGVPHPDP